MANVVNNPDFSLVDPGAGSILGWTRSTWEPKLCVGGSTPGPSTVIEYVAGRGARYYVTAEGRMEATQGVPGVLYAGPGFDANPGDTWTIDFDFQWAAYSVEYQDNLPCYGGPVREIFIRYGVTLWNPGTSHWDLFVAELPHYAIAQHNTSIGHAETLTDAINNDGPLDHYSESFTVPANFPSCRIQFAICHTPNAYSQTDWEDPDFPTPRGYGYRMYVNNVDLERTAVGTDGGSGSSPADSAYVFWPTPSYASGYPSGGYVNIEWDQFQLDPLYELQAAATTSAHQGDLDTDPGLVGVEVLLRSDGYPFNTPSFIAFEALYPGVVWESFFRAVTPGSGDPAGPIDLPPTDTIPASFPGITDFFSSECGPHQSRVFGATYLLVGEQEYATRNLLGAVVYGTLEPAVMYWMHPYSRPLGAQPFTTTVIGVAFLETDLPFPDPQEFDYTLPCSQGLHIDDRIGVVA